MHLLQVCWDNRVKMWCVGQEGPETRAWTTAEVTSSFIAACGRSSFLIWSVLMCCSHGRAVHQAARWIQTWRQVSVGLSARANSTLYWPTWGTLVTYSRSVWRCTGTEITVVNSVDSKVSPGSCSDWHWRWCERTLWTRALCNIIAMFWSPFFSLLSVLL